MEHIIQFGIGIDDEAIIKRVEAKAEDTIMQEIRHDAKAAIFKVAADRLAVRLARTRAARELKEGEK